VTSGGNADVSKKVIDDARAAYTAWKESSSGSYVERVLADSIVRDILPALIHVAERGPAPLGFETTSVDLETDTDIANEG